MIWIQIPEELIANEPALAAETAQQALTELLTQAAEAALRVGKADAAGEMSVALSDDAHLHEMNHQFLDVDAPTDVLSFPNGETDPDDQALYLGDVIISYERARAQAAAGGHALDDELRLLVVHGALHLLGHDHAEDDEKAVMWALQTQALEALGCPLRP